MPRTVANTGWVARTFKRLSARFGYDAAKNKNRRRPPNSILKSEDRELTGQERRALIGSARDLQRNFSIAAWAIRRHLDYVSTFAFQAKTPSPTLNAVLENLVAEWSAPRNCDAARRHSLAKILRLAEARRTLDGDVFLIRLADGRVQPVEGDRVRMPTGGWSDTDKIDREKMIEGVLVDDVGAAIAYCVCKRTKVGGFEFERMVPAENIEHHAYFDRFDQVRGISPLTTAINPMQDTYEGFDYALAKMKVAQLFGVAFYREDYEPPAVVDAATETDVDAGDAAETDDEAGSPRKIDLGRGPVAFDLEDGEKVDVIESHTPSNEFQTFSRQVIAVALKALDIPFSFFDESFTNYSGSRQALLQYEMSAGVKRQDNRDLLDRLTAWRFGLWLADGALVLPSDLTAADLAWEWIAKGMPWIDPLKEVNADIAAVGAGLTSRTRICKARGEDFTDIAGELADENKLLTKLGLPVNVKPANAQIVEIAQ